MSLSKLERAAFQALLLEYENELRNTSPGDDLPIPPPQPIGDDESLEVLRRVREYLDKNETLPSRPRNLQQEYHLLLVRYM